MLKQRSLWHWLVTALEAGQAAALMVVADNKGSSPGTRGAKMAITLQDAVGTIGGGLIETGMIKQARTMLAEGSTLPILLRRAHHASKTIQPSGMVCGGEQTVLIYPCSLVDKPLFERLMLSCERSDPILLRISAQGLQVLAQEISISSPQFEGEKDWCYLENIGAPKRAFIIGGGHVGMALSKILDTLNFDITVIDERESLDTMQANAYVKQKQCHPYADISRHIPEGTDVFVFIMTHSHHDDQTVLTELAGKQLAYLGLLGSRQKIDHMKQVLAHQLQTEQWQSLHAPMGLTIGSHTPEEIAVSIAAEVIQVVNKPA